MGMKGVLARWQSFVLITSCGELSEVCVCVCVCVCLLLPTSVFVGTDVFVEPEFEQWSKKVEEVEPQWSSHLQEQPALINLLWAKFISSQEPSSLSCWEEEQNYKDTFSLHALKFTLVQCIFSLAVDCKETASVLWIQSSCVKESGKSM